MTGANESMGRTIARYFNSMLIKQLIGVAVAVLRPKFLTPEHFGLFSLLKVIPNYASYVHLGSRATARYSIPRLLSEGLAEEVRAVQGTLFFGTLWSNLVFVVIFLVTAWPASDLAVDRAGVVAVCAVVLLTWYNEHIVTLLKAHQRFDIVGRSNYLGSAVTFVTLPLVYFFEVYGLFASMIFSVLFLSVYLGHAFPLERGQSFDWRRYAGLIRVGFPIMSLGLILMAVRTVDRFIISGILGNEQLGYYGVGAMIFNLLMQLPTVSREVLEPRLMQSLSSRSDRENMESFLVRPLLNTAYLMPFLVGGAFFGAPVAIHWLLPRYAPGIPATQIMMVGAFFLGLGYITRGIIVARDWQLAVLAPAGLVLAASTGCCALAAWGGLGIEGVAAVSSLSLAVLFAIMLGFIRKRAGRDVADWARLVRLLSVPAAAMAVLLGGYRIAAGSQWDALWYNVAGGAVYMALMALVVLWAVRRFPELEDLRLWKVLGKGK